MIVLYLKRDGVQKMPLVLNNTLHIMLRPRTWHHLEALGFLHQEAENLKLKNWTLKKIVIKRTNEKKNNLIVRIMKIGENCDKSWSWLSYTALDLAWCDLKGQKRLLTWLQRSFFCNITFMIQVQYELEARNSNFVQIWHGVFFFIQVRKSPRLFFRFQSDIVIIL